jgi:CheY-like chemotaxis protein
VAAARILLVDDQRDIARMLRAALETLGPGYAVVDVPSAEEALLEIRRAPVDLLVTDLRLPGITGLELIKRLRAMANTAQMMVISAYADERTQTECRRLGATFIAKPLSLDTFLRAVQQLLGGDNSTWAQTAAPAAEPVGITDRLTRLRRDLGAIAVFLLDLDGQITVRAGDVIGADLDVVLAPLMTAFSAALRVSQLLGKPQPANVIFFDGQSFDFYVANVGRFFALVMIFDGDRGSAQMGPVMRYGRQCVDDLLNSLRHLGVEPGAAAPVSSPPTPEPAAPEKPARKPGSGRLSRKGKTAPLGASKSSKPKPATQAVLPPDELAQAAELPPEELAALEAAAKKVDAAAAAAFWESAAAAADLGDVRADTLSWEQAAKLGLLPPEK